MTATECFQGHPKHGSEGPVKSLQFSIGSQELWHIFRRVRAQHHKGSCPDQLQSSRPRHYLPAPLTQSYSFTWREKNRKRVYSQNIHKKKEQAHNFLPQKEGSSSPILSIFLLPCPCRISENLLEKSPRDFLSLLQTYLYRFKEMKAFVG